MNSLALTNISHSEDDHHNLLLCCINLQDYQISQLHFVGYSYFVLGKILKPLACLQILLT